MAYPTEVTTGIAAEWTAVTQADNASAAPSVAANTTKRHYITKVVCGYSAAPAAAKTMTLTDGATNVVRCYFTTTDFGTKVFDFNPPLEFTVNSIASATLPASGTGGVLGHISIHGFTR